MCENMFHLWNMYSICWFPSVRLQLQSKRPFYFDTIKVVLKWPCVKCFSLTCTCCSHEWRQYVFKIKRKQNVTDKHISCAAGGVLDEDSSGVFSGIFYSFSLQHSHISSEQNLYYISDHLCQCQKKCMWDGVYWRRSRLCQARAKNNIF